MSEAVLWHDVATCPICLQTWDTSSEAEPARVRRAFKAGATMLECVRHFDLQLWRIEQIVREGLRTPARRRRPTTEEGEG